MTQQVLVVDDDLAECELLQRALHSADMQVLILTESRQANGILNTHTFDAIFVDVHMPPPDGLEITRQIRASDPNKATPIIMITGYQDPSIMARGFQAGITFFLYKPIVKDRLLNLVRLTHSVNRVEKRRFHRVQVRRNVKMKIDQDFLEGDTIDVSLNGVCVRTSKTFALGSPVKMSMELFPGQNPLTVSGLVARQAGQDSMGIHFNAIGIRESTQLQDFLLPLMIAPDGTAR